MALYQLSYYRMFVIAVTKVRADFDGCNMEPVTRIKDSDKSSTRELCGRRDSNSYASRHQILSLARLPFRHARRTDPAKAGESDPLEIRTPDTLIKSQVLCQLS